MQIKVIASSSAGCCYLIESGDEQILIECGISLSKIREALNFDLSKVVVCLVSHEHKDHCKSAQDVHDKTPITLIGGMGLTNHFDLFGLKVATDKRTFFCGNEFSIRAVLLPHDVECFGYIVKAGESLLFYATDTGAVDIQIPGLTHLMIETNHSVQALFDSPLDKSLVSRISENHLSIDKALDFAVRHKDTLKEVHLMHLSDVHGDEKEFKRLAQEALGLPVYIAKK